MTTAHKLPLLLAITFGVVAMTSSSVFTSVAHAQAPVINTDNQLVLTAIPPRMGEDGTLRLKPGDKTQVTLRVRNSSTQTIEIKTLARDFIIGEDGSTPIPVDSAVSNRWSLANWLTIVPNLQTLDPDELAGVSVLIEVPEDALPGGHYAMIMHSPNIDTAEINAENSAAITQEVGTLLYVIVEGPINEQAFIRDFQFNEGNFAEFGPVPFNFVIENESDVHIRPQLNVEIFDFIGRKVATLQPETKNIFPLTSREFNGEWDQIWGTGYYNAQLTASYGTQGSVIMAKTSFWLLPIKLVITVIILILTLIAILISIHRHMAHRRDDRNKKISVLEDKLKELESEKLKKFED